MEALTRELDSPVVVTLLNEICSFYGGTYPSRFMKCITECERRILALRYLRACDWKLEDALEMIKKSTFYFEETNADAISLFPCVFPLRGFVEEDICRVLSISYGEKDEHASICRTAITPNFPAGYHHFDKNGNPVLYTFPGRSRVKQLLKAVEVITAPGKSIKDTLLPYHLYENLVQECVVRYSNAKSLEKGGPIIIGSTVVVDVEGLNFGLLNNTFVDIARAFFSIDQSHFPEFLDRLFVINSPSLAKYAFKILKPSLNKRTRDKICFCTKSESPNVLKKIIDEDKIPAFLGGFCKCEGGCIPGIDGDCHKSIDAETSVALYPISQNVLVEAGGRHVVEVSLQPEEVIQWSFHCTKPRGSTVSEILFQVTFISSAYGDALVISEDKMAVSLDNAITAPTENSSEEPERYMLVKSVHVEADHDCFVSLEKGVLRFEWNNHKSWIHSKEVKLCITRK